MLSDACVETVGVEELTKRQEDGKQWLGNSSGNEGYIQLQECLRGKTVETRERKMTGIYFHTEIYTSRTL